MELEPRIGVCEIARHFEELEDPRCSVNRLHPLPSVLTIALLGVLAGADGPMSEAMLRYNELEGLGFGLDLSRCAATGRRDELAFVSPKSGRAVSRSAGDPYRDRMFALPAFLLAAPSTEAVPTDELAAGFRLTGYFFARHVYEPRGLTPPEARERFIALATRTAEAPVKAEIP